MGELKIELWTCGELNDELLANSENTEVLNVELLACDDCGELHDELLFNWEASGALKEELGA